MGAVRIEGKLRPGLSRGILGTEEVPDTFTFLAAVKQVDTPVSVHIAGRYLHARRRIIDHMPCPIPCFRVAGVLEPGVLDTHVRVSVAVHVAETYPGAAVTNSPVAPGILGRPRRFKVVHTFPMVLLDDQIIEAVTIEIM